jgi:hypothetical protein
LFLVLVVFSSVEKRGILGEGKLGIDILSVCLGVMFGFFDIILSFAFWELGAKGRVFSP